MNLLVGTCIKKYQEEGACRLPLHVNDNIGDSRGCRRPKACDNLSVIPKHIFVLDWLKYQSLRWNKSFMCGSCGWTTRLCLLKESKWASCSLFLAAGIMEQYINIPAFQHSILWPCPKMFQSEIWASPQWRRSSFCWCCYFYFCQLLHPLALFQIIYTLSLVINCLYIIYGLWTVNWLLVHEDTAVLPHVEFDLDLSWLCCIHTKTKPVVGFAMLNDFATFLTWNV